MGNKMKVALVTGGARGIGDAISLALQASGSKVFSLDLTAPENPRSGITYIEGDVSNPQSVASAFQVIDGQGDGIDTVIHNAGVQRSALCGKMSYEDWSLVLRTHLDGMFICASEAIPRMIRQGRGGSITGIASTAAFVGLPGRSPYTAAKAGIVGLVRCLAVEAAPHRIRVNAVAPGFTKTAIVKNAISDGSLNEDWMLERVPLKRLAEPSEIANAVKFLSSDEATYMTGQTVVVDGGWTAQGINHAPDWLVQS